MNNEHLDLYRELAQLAGKKANPTVWMLGWCIGIIVSLCRYDSANKVRVYKQLRRR
jgi:hypothetical protein